MGKRKGGRARARNGIGEAWGIPPIPAAVVHWVPVAAVALHAPPRTIPTFIQVDAEALRLAGRCCAATLICCHETEFDMRGIFSSRVSPISQKWRIAQNRFS